MGNPTATPPDQPGACGSGGAAGLPRSGAGRGGAGAGGVRQVLGRFGEELAADHLTSRGLTVLDRNWRCREGEIDIVARDGDVVVFCEVKTRSGVSHGTPAEAVTPAKARRLRVLACRWLAEHHPGCSDVRFDVVAVLRGRDGVQVDHRAGVI